MDALGENPAFLMMLAAPVAGLLVAARHRAGPPGPTLLPLALLLLALPWLLDRLIDTPREKLGRDLETLRITALAADPERVMNGIAPDFRAKEFDRTTLERAIRDEFANVQPASLSFNGRRLDVNGDSATASFVLTVSGTYRKQPIDRYAMRLKLHFRRTGDRWLITNAQRFDLVEAGKEISLRVR